MSRKFDDALNDCLERVARGEDMELCAQSYPEHAQKLRPLLRAAQSTMQAAASARYRPQARIKGLRRLEQALAEGRVRKRQRLPALMWRPAARPLAVGFAAVFLTLVAAGGTTIASSNSVPGEPLYWVKTTRENISLSMPGSDMNKAQAHIHLASVRGQEMNRLVAEQRFQEAEQMIYRLRHHLRESATYARVEVSSDPLEMPNSQLRIQRVRNYLVLRATLEQDGTVLRAHLLRQMQEMPPGHRMKIRRMMGQSELGYRVLIEAMDDAPPTDGQPLWIVPRQRFERR